MRDIISKELLSEVLGKSVKITDKTKLGIFESELKGTCLKVSNGLSIFTINIHELTYKCKEWAYKYGFEIAAYRVQDSIEYRCLVGHNTINFNGTKSGYYAESEPEAIFKACQWILDSRKTMKEIISKELLSEVLGYTISSLYIAPNKTFIEVHSEGVDKRFNTYELAHKCKEWSIKHGYLISSGLTFYENGYFEIYIDPQGDIIKDGNSNTELEAIFKACQWILENKENQ